MNAIIPVLNKTETKYVSINHSAPSIYFQLFKFDSYTFMLERQHKTDFRIKKRSTLHFMDSYLKNYAHDVRGQEYVDLAWDDFSNGGPQQNRRLKEQFASSLSLST